MPAPHLRIFYCKAKIYKKRSENAKHFCTTHKCPHIKSNSCFQSLEMSLTDVNRRSKTAVRRFSSRTKVLDRKKLWCYDAANNFIQQMHLSGNQYIRKYRQRVVGWCKTTGKAVWNSFCKQCTERRDFFK